MTNVYPPKFSPEHLLAEIKAQYQHDDHKMLEEKSVFVSVAGRIMQKRIMGKAGFIDLQDSSGRLQIYLKADALKNNQINLDDLKLWHILGIKGYVFKTKTNELSIKAQEVFLLTKALNAIPTKGDFYAVKDVEFRYRQRYVDLIVNAEVRNVFILRSRLIKAIRKFFDEKDYLEVETPMMHPIPGGAVAKPFITHHNALNMPLYLRVAPELYLKRLVVGGFEKVYEINRNFRNEGLSTRHSPEFTMLEFYEAYADYEMLMSLIESLLRYLVQTLFEQSVIEYQGEQYNFNKPFERLSIKQALLKYNVDLQSETLEDLHKLHQWGSAHLKTAQYTSLGELQFALFEETVEKQLRQPTFITEYPIEVSPLARRNDQNPNIADRFELYIGGRELANGFSELNDPIDQAERFKAQLASKKAGNLEAMEYDHDYIKALEYGLPPTAGAGLGIDRLMMLLANVTSIRDVILFPLLRPQASTKSKV